MKTILVVDDNAICREPIAAALRSKGYEALEAADGQEALRITRTQTVDLILLDVTMPGMDGLAVLDVLRQDPQWKHLPVILLTDVAEKAHVLRAIKVGVQGYLLKSDFSLDDMLSRIKKCTRARDSKNAGSPAQPQQENSPPVSTTAPVAQRACHGGADRPVLAPMDKDSVWKRIHDEIQLWSAKPVLQHIVALTRSSTSTLDEVASALRQDPALAIKVMKVANSSLYCTGKHVTTLPEAAQRIGLSAVRNAAMAVLAIEHLDTNVLPDFDPQHFWEHSLASAVLAESIGAALELQHADQLFLAGLFHDTGRLVLATIYPKECEAILTCAASQNVDLQTLERQVFQISHADVTRELLTQWGIPKTVAEAAALHDLLPPQIQRASQNPANVQAVALANRLAHALVLGDSGNSMLLTIHEHIEALGLSSAAIRTITRAAINKTRDISTFYSTRENAQLPLPFASQLAKQAGQPIKAAVLAGEDSVDPLTLFCEQLGWSDIADPRVAVLWIAGAQDLAKRFSQLQDQEAKLERKLGIAIASPNHCSAAPADLLNGRSFATICLPVRYEKLVEILGRAGCDSPKNDR